MSNSHLVEGPHPHVHPVKVYWIVFGLLLMLTGVTVWVAGYDFGSFSAAVALLVAGTKACLVLAVFMHLWFDNKFYALVISSSLVFLFLFFLFTLIDEGSRTFMDPQRANFMPRDEVVHQYELDHPGALPLRPGLKEPVKENLIFEGPEHE